MQSSSVATTHDLGRAIESYFDRLWPLNRSITGPGYRASLDVLAELMPMERLRFETGRRVFDWVVPEEWNARAAYFVDPHGIRHADYAVNNLHLVSYSVPVNGTMALAELRPHLYSIPDNPDAVPYVTSYYARNWGFCLTDRELRQLPDGTYRVVIDSELYDGHVEVGEAVLRGDTDQEVLFSSYLCHPSLANDQLSGPIVLAFLYERLGAMPQRRYTYRFVIWPETIGSLCYLSLRGQQLKERLVAGFQLACLGDPGAFTYKLSRRGDTLADRAARIMLRDRGTHRIVPFDPSNGSDERQLCAPGFDLPFGGLLRTMYGVYPQYHTSLDNKACISLEALAGSVEAAADLAAALEKNERWRNTVQFGEPQLGRRGLYPNVSSSLILAEDVQAAMWLLNFADGRHDLFDIAERSNQKLAALVRAAEPLSAVGLLEKIRP